MTGIVQRPGSGRMSAAIVGTALCWSLGLAVCAGSVVVALGGSLVTRGLAFVGLMLGAAICGWARAASPLWKMRLVAVVILSGLGGLGTEAVLRMVSRYPRPAISRLIPDADVGFTLDPGRTDVDRRGFRNPEDVGRVHVVTIGDGITEGVNVRAHETWPACLQKLMNVPVYNMGVSCFGPREYVRAVRNAFTLEPRHVVVCINMSDDFGKCVETASTSPPDESYRALVKTRTAVGSYLHHQWQQWTRPVRGDSHRLPGPHDVDVSAERLLQVNANVDAGNASVTARLQQTVAALRQLEAECRSRNAALSVLLVPTRETVYLEHHGGESDDDPLTDIQRKERVLVESVQRQLMGSGIAVVDVLPLLRSALEAGQDPFEHEEHGYPQPAGYAVLASAVAQSFSTDTPPGETLISN